MTPPDSTRVFSIIIDGKTEEYTISRNSSDEWKKCKILGSLIDTISDINRRKALTVNAYTKFNNIFNSRKVSTIIKIRTYVQCVLLTYNCEV